MSHSMQIVNDKLVDLRSLNGRRANEIYPGRQRANGGKA